MKIQLTRNTVVDGQLRGAGDIVEAHDETGKLLVLMGKAIPARNPLPDGEGETAPVIVSEPESEPPSPSPLPQGEESIEIAPPPPTRRHSTKKGGK